MRSTIKDNRGFSLVEFIVIILIMSVLGGAAIVTMSVVLNADSEKAAQTLCAVLDNARTKAMALNEGAIDADDNVRIVARVVQRDNGDYYAGVYQKTTVGGVETIEALDEKKMCNYRIDIYAGKMNSDILNLKNEDGSDLTKLVNDATGEANGIEMLEWSFKKSTGGVESTSCVLAPGAPVTAGFLDVCIDGMSDKYKVVFAPASGRSYVIEY